MGSGSLVSEERGFYKTQIETLRPSPQGHNNKPIEFETAVDESKYSPVSW
jgi:hypothetical protein